MTLGRNGSGEGEQSKAACTCGIPHQAGGGKSFMGLTAESIRFLAEAWPGQGRVNRVLTLGRQGLWVAPARLEGILRTHGLWGSDWDSAAFEARLTRADWRLAELLRQMGVAEVHACDASGFEGADLIHDLNLPVPGEWEEHYDLVIDGGTLEHVFNLPVALGNAMRMVRTGGRLVLFTPANNYCGHGFYQFSPELFWRVFTEANGYRVNRLEAMVDTEGYSSCLGVKYSFPIRSARHRVMDPAGVGERVLLVNRAPTLLFVEAIKERHVEPFRQAPQQSDYSAQWQANVSASPMTQTGAGIGLSRLLTRLFSEKTCREILPRLVSLLDFRRRARFLRSMSFANRRHYSVVRRSPRKK